MNLPPSSKLLGYKYNFKRKLKADESIDKYKDMLVIKYFKLKEGLNYFDTYVVVKRITSIRMIIAIAALQNLKIHQMDLKIAFLNGDFDEKFTWSNQKGLLFPGKKIKCASLSNPSMD